mmetsp:Transcript_9933/g.24585  ORF Transcript_9933/g.24585 Transcript_9933/m.24585 type:complete len:260 (+) Transcript_9933:395-1174(+)
MRGARPSMVDGSLFPSFIGVIAATAGLGLGVHSSSRSMSSSSSPSYFFKRSRRVLMTEFFFATMFLRSLNWLLSPSRRVKSSLAFSASLTLLTRSIFVFFSCPSRSFTIGVPCKSAPIWLFTFAKESFICVSSSVRAVRSRIISESCFCMLWYLSCSMRFSSASASPPWAAAEPKLASTAGLFAPIPCHSASSAIFASLPSSSTALRSLPSCTLRACPCTSKSAVCRAIMLVTESISPRTTSLIMRPNSSRRITTSSWL